MKFYIPFTDKIIVENADRHVWYYKLNRDFLKVVNHFTKWSESFFCVICKRNHKIESSLRHCLFYHRAETINYFIDNEMIVGDSN
jgi:hypothetical protein